MADTSPGSLAAYFRGTPAFWDLPEAAGESSVGWIPLLNQLAVFSNSSVKYSALKPLSAA